MLIPIEPNCTINHGQPQMTQLEFRHRNSDNIDEFPILSKFL